MAALTLGTRASALALWQARHVQAALAAHDVPVALEEIRTTGDRIQDRPLSKVGDKGLFTKELDLALLEGRIHLAVHSLKDLPTRLPAGLVLAAVTERAAPWDAFVAHPDHGGGLADLPPGAVVATSSLRRTSQLRAWRDDLDVVSVRGNVDTRLAKLDASAWGGMILAEAGLVRLGLGERVRERIPLDVMVPAVSQGALGIVCADTDAAVHALLREALHHAPTAAAVGAERAFLRRLEGGCSVPIGAYARIEGETLVLEGCVGALDGRRLVRDRAIGRADDAEAMGDALAGRLLAAGADAILADVRAAKAAGEAS